MLKEHTIRHGGKVYRLEPAIDFHAHNTGQRGTYQTGRYLVGEITTNASGADEYGPLGLSVGSVSEFMEMLND